MILVFILCAWGIPWLTQTNEINSTLCKYEESKPWCYKTSSNRLWSHHPNSVTYEIIRVMPESLWVSSLNIVVPRGRAPFSQHQESRRFEWICEHNRLRPEPIRLVRLDSEHAQSDGKPVNRGFPELDLVKGHSRPQRPRSFWSAPRIATSGQV